MDIRDCIVEMTGAERIERVERIQSLWGGYGELVRAHVVGAPDASVIAKCVRLPPASAGDVSHARKCRSYDAELAFYRAFAPRCDDTCRVARLVGHRKERTEWLLVLEDLDAAGFGERRHDPKGVELEACLGWLAAFHARFLGVSPEGLWAIGTYWHLDTRQEELTAMRDDALRASAPAIDRALRDARFQTIVHGDAKPDNFCFAYEGTHVAAVDFQYVGGGCGIKDVAYLLHGESLAVEARSLAVYFERLLAALPPECDKSALEREWRSLYPVARDDFRRFLAGWKQ